MIYQLVNKGELRKRQEWCDLLLGKLHVCQYQKEVDDFSCKKRSLKSSTWVDLDECGWSGGKIKKINEVKKKTKLWWCVSQVCLMVLMMRWVVTKVRKGLFVRHYHKQRITLLQENNNNKKRVFFVHLLNHKFFVHLNLLFFRISVCFMYGFVCTSP